MLVRFGMRFANQYLNPALAFAIIIFVAAGYVLSAIYPTTIIAWDILLIVSLVLAAGIVFLYAKPQQTEKSLSLLQTALALVPYLIFLPGVWILLTSPELQISYHGDFHVGYVNQLIYGNGQPENVYLPGTPANYYWLYHTLIAVISHIFQIPHTIARSILSFLILASLLGWVHRVVILVTSKEYPPIIHSMLVIFVLFGMNLLGSIQSMVGMWDDFNIWHLWEIIAPVSINDIRLETLYAKFITYTSFPLVLLFSWIMIYVAVKLIKQRATVFDMSLFVLGIAGGTAFLIVGGALMLGTLSVAVFTTWLVLCLRGTRSWKEILAGFRAQNWYETIPLLISLLSCAAMLVYAYSAIAAYASSTSDHHLSIIPLLSSLDNATSIFFGLYPLTFFILLGFYLAWRETDEVLLLFAFAFIVMMYAALVLESSDAYKLILIGSCFATLMTARIINRLAIFVQNNESPVYLGIPLIVGFYLLAALNIISFTGGTLTVNNMLWSQMRGYSYHNSELESTVDPYNDVYVWMRESIEPDVWLVMRPDDTDRSALLSEHLPYVADVYLTPIYANVPEWGVRATLLYTITNTAINSPEWQSAWNELQAKLDDQAHVYVFPNDMSASELEDVGLERLFEGDYASVYRIRGGQ